MLEMSMLVFGQGVFLKTELEKEELFFWFGTVRERCFIFYLRRKNWIKRKKKRKECAYDTHIINNEEV